MKKLILLLFIPLVSFGQGEQLYAEGSDFDQDGNTFEWISYGQQDWSIENADVVTYRDGTPIPEVTQSHLWDDLTTGAWSYYDNDPSKPRLYNLLAVLGIHDNDPNTPNKEFAPEGWHVPSDDDWTTLENYLISNGYNYDGTTTDNKIAKAMSSTTGWDTSTNAGAIGNDQSQNNSSGFNALPTGLRNQQGSFNSEDIWAYFWSSSENSTLMGWYRYLDYNSSNLGRSSDHYRYGFSVRFVRNNSTASLNDLANSIDIFPNPSSEYINVSINTELEAVVFDLLGKELIRENINGRLDISCLDKGTYIVNLTDGINTSTHKIIKE